MSAVRINGKYFGSKKDAAKFFRLVLDQHREGEAIKEGYKLDVVYLFSHHPYAASKAPEPISDFICAVDDEYNTKCFAVRMNIGGITIDNKFSVRKCLRNFNHFKKREREEAITIDRDGSVFPLF